MKFDRTSFRRRAVSPIACLREGWQLIKDDYWLFFGITTVGFLLGSLAALFLMGPVMCGIHYCLLRQECRQRVEFGMLFRGFDYFLPALIATLFMILPTIVLGIAAYLLTVAGVIGTFAAFRPAPGEQPDAAFFGTIIGIMVLYMLSIMLITTIPEVLFFFTYPLIVDRGLSGYEATILSVRAVFGNLFGVIGVVILTKLLTILGTFLCLFGVYLTHPITMAMMAVAYRQVFGLEDLRLDFDDDRELPEEDPYRVGRVETGIQGGPNTAVSPNDAPGPDTKSEI